MPTTSALIAPRDLMRALEKIAIPISPSSGTVLFERGDHVRGIFLINKGKVGVKLDGSADVFPARTLGPGSILGLPATLSGDAYSLTAITDTECQIGYVPRAVALDLLRSHSRLCLQAMQVLSEEISGMRSAITRSRPKRCGARADGTLQVRANQ